MIFGSDSEDDGDSSSAIPGLKRNVPTKISIVYGKSTYDLEFTADDFANEEKPAKGLTVLSLKFIVSRILTPKILTADTANHGQREADSGANGGSKLINPNNFTLIYKGRKLTDDKQYLLDYKVKQGGKVLVMVSNPERVAAAAAAATRSSKISSSTGPATSGIPRRFPVKPLTPSEEIKKVLEQLDAEIVPLITKFIEHPPESEQARKDEHHRISELVLQKMFMMDGIDASDDPTVRQQRKEAINTMHEHLASIDQVYKPPAEEAD